MAKTITTEEQLTAACTLECVIPFDGFYGSSHDSELDSELEQMTSDDHGMVYPYAYDVSGNVRWAEVHLAYAQQYLTEFRRTFQDETGMAFPAVFSELSSPREYNFATDRIFAKIPPALAREMFRAVDKKKLRERIAEEFSSRSGFISFYPNTLDAWLGTTGKESFYQTFGNSKPGGPVTTWDANQLGTLVSVFFDQHCTNDDALKGWDIMDRPRGNGFFDEIIYSAMDDAGCDIVSRAGDDRNNGVSADDVDSATEDE